MYFTLEELQGLLEILKRQNLENDLANLFVANMRVKIMDMIEELKQETIINPE